MSGDIPFGFGQPRDPDDESGATGSGGGGGGLPPGFGSGGGFGSNDPLGAGGSEGFDMANLGAALQQLGAMLQSSGGENAGPVNWEMATDIARKEIVEAGDPSVPSAQQRSVEEAVGLADMWLDPATEFPATAGSAKAWSRSEWLIETMPA